MKNLIIILGFITFEGYTQTCIKADSVIHGCWIEINPYSKSDKEFQNYNLNLDTLRFTKDHYVTRYLTGKMKWNYYSEKCLLTGIRLHSKKELIVAEKFDIDLMEENYICDSLKLKNDTLYCGYMLNQFMFPGGHSYRKYKRSKCP